MIANLRVIKVIRGGKVFLAKFSVLAHVIGLNERNQPLFTELKKIALVSRYVVSNVA